MAAQGQAPGQQWWTPMEIAGHYNAAMVPVKALLMQDPATRARVRESKALGAFWVRAVARRAHRNLAGIVRTGATRQQAEAEIPRLVMRAHLRITERFFAALQPLAFADVPAGTNCVLCRDAIIDSPQNNKGKPLRLRVCGHIFHADCFCEAGCAALGSIPCPVCRAPFLA